MATSWQTNLSTNKEGFSATLPYQVLRFGKGDRADVALEEQVDGYLAQVGEVTKLAEEKGFEAMWFIDHQLGVDPNKPWRSLPKAATWS